MPIAYPGTITHYIYDVVLSCRLISFIKDRAKIRFFFDITKWYVARNFV